MATPQQIADKWSRRLAGSREDMEQGANAVTESPGVAAAESIDRYREGIERALSSGKTESAMRAVTVEDWRSRYKTKGIANAIAAANNEGTKRKVAEFQQELAPVVSQIRARVREMKRNGASGRDRALFAMDAMEAFGNSRR